MIPTTEAPIAEHSPLAPSRSPLIEIVIPVHNEQEALEPSVRRLHEFLTANLRYAWRIVIADNASTDATLFIARELVRELPQLSVMHLQEKGRGRALRAAWSSSQADVVCYMDVDLSTDLRALLPLVAAVVSGHSDVAIGTRLANGSRVLRSPKRELISRSYNRILRLGLGARFSDAQCGFKAIRTDIARRLLREVVDQGWFFDTELLILAQRQGLRIHEVAVDWVEDPDSRVDIVRTALDDLRGVLRLRFTTPAFRPGQGVARNRTICSVSRQAWFGGPRTRETAHPGSHASGFGYFRLRFATAPVPSMTRRRISSSQWCVRSSR